MPSCFPSREKSLGWFNGWWLPRPTSQLVGGILEQEEGEPPSKAGGIGQFTSWIKSVGRPGPACHSWNVSIEQPSSLPATGFHVYSPFLPAHSSVLPVAQLVPAWKWRTMPRTIGYRSHRVKHVYLGTQSTLTATDSVFERVSLKRTSWRYSAQDWLLRIGYCDRDVWMILFTS